MFFDTIENKMIRNDKKIKELSIKTEALNREIDSFYNEINICQKQLSEYSKNKENFLPQVWQALEEQRAALNEKLPAQQEEKNLQETSNRFQEQHIARHWIPVR